MSLFAALVWANGDGGRSLATSLWTLATVRAALRRKFRYLVPGNETGRSAVVGRRRRWSATQANPER